MAEQDALYKALVAAQAAMENASKDKNNPHFKSKYADLASARAAVTPALTANGLCIVQQPETDADGAVFVRTILAHESGQTLRHEGPHVQLGQKRDAQAVGSVISYLRRYNLMAVCGIAADDDDGNGAVGMDPSRRGPRQDNSPPQPNRDDGPPPHDRETGEVRATKRGGEPTPKSLRVPALMKIARDGREYDDWPARIGKFQQWVETAATREDDKSDEILVRLWAENSDMLIDYGNTAVGMDGGWTAFEVWKEGVEASTGRTLPGITMREAAE